MISKQKQSIIDLRRRGFGYAQIARELSLSVNTVKSFCRRNSLMENTAFEDTKDSCKHCGKELILEEKKKPKMFCGDTCRFAWWNAHRDEMRRRDALTQNCSFCGGAFESLMSANRKYCCRACYFKARYGKDEDRHDKRAI